MEESNAIDPDPADILADTSARLSVCLSARAEQDPQRKSVSIQVEVYYLINIYIPSLKQVLVTVNQSQRN